MRILFDQGTPAPLRIHLPAHTVQTAFERGWSNLNNGDLLKTAEPHFDLIITTDKNLQYQQNLAGRTIAILILPTTSWPRIERHHRLVAAAVESIASGAYVELQVPR